MSNIILSPRNVVILFDNELTDEFIRLSSIINKYVPSKVLLNRTDMFPHISVYSTNFPDYNLVKVEEQISKLVENLESFFITISGKVVDMQTIFLNFDPSQELQNLHNLVVNSLNNLRNGMYDKKELELISNHEGRKKSLIAYGMWAAKELYVPHISLARPYDSSLCNKALKLIPDKINYTFMVNRISFVERGHDGTCRKILKTFRLI